MPPTVDVIHPCFHPPAQANYVINVHWNCKLIEQFTRAPWVGKYFTNIPAKISLKQKEKSSFRHSMMLEWVIRFLWLMGEMTETLCSSSCPEVLDFSDHRRREQWAELQIKTRPMAAQVFNPSAPEAETGGSLIVRLPGYIGKRTVKEKRSWAEVA